jgi:hypothetical protein
VNRRIALALILALLVQSPLPGLAMALPDAPTGGQTLLICTVEGLKQVELDGGAQGEEVPQAEPCCPCAIPCGACVLPPLERLSARVVDVTTVALPVQADAAVPIAAPVPPHQSRAPPPS